MTEPDVTITDFLLATESFVLAALVATQPYTHPDIRLWFVVFFAATGVASTLGGVFHGFFVAPASPLGTRIWRGTLVAVGVATSASWMLGAAIIWPGTSPALMSILVAIELTVYVAIVLLVSDAFRVAVFNQIPATCFLLVAYALRYQAMPESAVAIGLGGIGVTALSGLVQRLKVTLHPVYFTHNAVFHLLQGIALFMMFLSATHLVAR